ncbi:MAG TPA: DUF5074 domain-containing protein [Bacteroidales bacterium]|nr:DUF5074 domain-containing protein [Bacteroidales bacterium]HQQ12957.1 DUF5074 domain-containing protein [Bacteroidales bacterium]
MLIKAFRLASELLLFIVTVAMIFSCTKTPVDEPIEYENKLGNGFYVLNEGNFTYGNASMSYYQSDSSKMLQQVFYNRNDVPLGDVAQGMTFWGDYAFVIVNNSGIVWAINAETAKIVSKLSGLHSPRYMIVIDANKSYISDFQMKGITVVNTSTLQAQGTILTGKTTERMVLYQDKVFVANWSNYNQTSTNNTIQVIDVIRDKLTDSIVVTKEPNSMVLDKFGKLWVLCSGGYLNEEQPALYKINTTNLAIESVFTFQNINSSPNQLTINASSDTLYFINNNIYRMPVDATSLPEHAFVDRKNRNFYHLAVDPNTSEVLATDAGNYLQSGYVFRFKPDGTIIDSLAAGIIPGFIGFNRNH